MKLKIGYGRHGAFKLRILKGEVKWSASCQHQKEGSYDCEFSEKSPFKPVVYSAAFAHISKNGDHRILIWKEKEYSMEAKRK